MNRFKQSLASLPTPSLPSFGASSPDERPTPAPLDPERLAALAARRDVTGTLVDAFAQHVRTLNKQRANPLGGNATDLSSRFVGEAMVNGAEELKASGASSSEDTYAHVLARTGELYLAFTQLATVYHDQLTVGFLDTIEQRAEDYKDLDKAVKEADKKRSALEAVMTKMEKGKKDPSDYERELENAEDVYADECRRLQLKADRLEDALEGDIDALKQLVKVQLEYARNYVTLLEDCQSAFAAGPSSFSSSRPRSTLQVPPASTRMSRSQSESSVHTPATSSSSGILSILGPNRSRRSTVSSQTSDGAAGGSEAGKTRSRSGSMLERFAIGNKSKKKDASPVATPPAEEPDGLDAAQQGTGTGTGSSTRFAPSMPSLPTLGSFKKLSLAGSGGGGKYGTLGEDASDPPAVSPTSSSSSSLSRRMPPALKRTQTAPAAAPVQTYSPRRAVPPLPPARGPVGKMYRAKWAYVPAASSAGHGTDDGADDEREELELGKGDVVRVEREVNTDWWIGSVISGAAGSGRRGMFPSAYVVPHDEPTGAHDREARWTTFGTESASLSSSTHDDGDDRSDSDGDGEQGLLDGPDRTASPFGDSASPARRTAPAPPQSRSRGSTVTAAGASSPFSYDGVSHLRVNGQTSRRA